MYKSGSSWFNMYKFTLYMKTLTYSNNKILSVVLTMFWWEEIVPLHVWFLKCDLTLVSISWILRTQLNYRRDVERKASKITSHIRLLSHLETRIVARSTVNCKYFWISLPNMMVVWGEARYSTLFSVSRLVNRRILLGLIRKRS